MQRGSGTEPIIELWRFNKAGPTGKRARFEDLSKQLLRTRVLGPSAPALQAFRKRVLQTLATRQEGIDAAGPDEALTGLTAAAKTVRNPLAPDRDRVDALVTVFRGLSDDILFERDEIGLALEALETGRWTAAGKANIDDLEYKAQIDLVGGGRLDLRKEGDGWLVDTIWPMR